MFMKDYPRIHRYYNKLDGLIALSVYVASMLMLYVTGLLVRYQGIRLFVPVSIVSLLTVLFVIRLRKQGLNTIGISARNIGKSALLGLVTGFAFFYYFRLIIGATLFERAYGGVDISRFSFDRFARHAGAPFWDWFPMALLFIIITVVHQEVLMRGYVQTRLHGLIGSEFATTLVTGLLFVIFFMPLHTVLTGETLSWVFLSSVPLKMLWMFGLHCWLYLLYRTYNNLAAPVIFHVFFSFHSNDALSHFTFIGI